MTVGPYKDHMYAQIVRQATAGTTQSTILGKAPCAGVLAEIRVTPALALTGDGTNNRIFTLFNRGQAGAGTTNMGTLTTTASWTDNVDFTIPLSGTPANLVVAKNDILELVETVGGTGVAHGGLQLDVTINRYVGGNG